MSTTAARRTRVVVVGAGFGGLAVARGLRDVPVDVLVVDRTNYHLFQPLLYQVATAALQPADIAYPIRGVLRRLPNATFRLAEVVGLDHGQRRLHTADAEVIAYDELVVAAGAATATFGVAGVSEHAFALKTMEDALRLRSHLLGRFEACDADPSLLDSGLLDTVVVGGGPTGVELAGALAELNGRVLARDFPQLDVTRARVVLVEVADELLGAFHPRSRVHAARELRRRGVEVLLGRAVAAVRPDGIELDGGAIVPAGTVVWAAGVRAAPLADALGFEQTAGGRICVGDDLAVPGHDGVWAVGDIAEVPASAGTPLPQLAPVAVQQGRHVATQIRHRLHGQPTAPFRYRDKGIMATIGRRAAVAEIGSGLRFRGTPGWLIWLFLHILQLIGFRNRLSVLVDWTWNYLTWERHSRLIIPTEAGRVGPMPTAAPPSSALLEHRRLASADRRRLP